LVNALNAAFRAQGVQSYKVTVLQSNQGANSFYRALGFQPTLEFELYKKKWNLYTIDVTRDT
jgi:ribosomal protein S18 acetylase RimI-like enzyme